MSEYEYQNPQFEDITELFFTAKIEGDGILTAPHFNLEDAVASIDLMHPKMDRGLVNIDGVSLGMYRHGALQNGGLVSRLAIAQEHPPRDLVERMMRTLESLMTTWMSGAAAADTLLTCLMLEGRHLLTHPTIRWYADSLARCCLMLADIILPTNVARPEEFLPNLHSLIDGRGDCDGDAALKWYISNRRGISSEFGPQVGIHCERLALWLRLLRQIKVVDLDYALMMALVEELSELWTSMPPGDAAHPEELLLEPLMANYFATGCVRRPIPLLSSADVILAWQQMLRSLSTCFTNYTRRVTFAELIVCFLQISSHEHRHKLCAVTRALSFATLLKGNLFYGHLPPGVYAQVSLGLEKPESATEQLLLDALQIALHSPARQRRLLPKLITAIHDRTQVHSESISFSVYYSNNSAPKSYSDVSRQKLKGLTHWLSIYYILLGFHLTLFEPYEIPEAILLMGKACDRYEVESFRALLVSAFDKHSHLHIHMRNQYSHVYDDCRMSHRWACLWPWMGVSLDDLARELHSLCHPSNDKDQREGDFDQSILYDTLCPVLWEALSAFLTTTTATK